MTKENAKNIILEWIDANKKPFDDLAISIWNEPELAHQESKAVKLQMDFLREQGFSISQKDGLATAFMAEWGSGGPVIGLLGEYDALPGLSQSISARPEPINQGGAGHGCGHNLLGVGCMQAACALKEALGAAGLSATLRYYGCPAEEVLTGKGEMAKLGYFDGLDMALTWHPNDISYVAGGTMTALFSAKFRFKGLTSHAGSAPQDGRSALDAVELMNVGANYLREHMLDQDRLHYVITNGGLAPNIVPSSAEVWYYARAPYAAELVNLWNRLTKVAQGAAMMTETEVSYELLGGCYNTLPNKVLNRVLEDNLFNFVGSPGYSAEDMKFAKELQETLPKSQIEAARMRSEEITEENYVLNVTPLHDPAPKNVIMGSTDVGDVAHIAPTSLLWSATVPVGVPMHSWQTVASCGSGIGLKGSTFAAKTMAAAAFDFVATPALLAEAKEEFARVLGGQSYSPMEDLLK